MSAQFENPPLLELVAELKWVPAGVKRSANDPHGYEIGPAFFAGSASRPDIAMNFAALVGAEGFQRVESLIPPSMPAMPHQLRYRYRQGNPPGPALYQIGHGIFTANIVPPYKSWSQFRPIVERGVELLLEAHGDKPPDSFLSVALRYIDIFTEEFTRGRSTQRFLKDILRVNIGLPDGLTKYLAEDQRVRPHLQLSMPLTTGQEMSFTVTEGKGGGSEGVIMDTTVSTTAPVPAAKDEVMRALDDAHTITHETFVALTADLRDIMRPQEVH